MAGIKTYCDKVISFMGDEFPDVDFVYAGAHDIDEFDKPHWLARLCVGDSEYMTAPDNDIRVARRGQMPGVLVPRIYFGFLLECNHTYITNNTALEGRDLAEAMGAAINYRKFLPDEMYRSELVGVEVITDELELPPVNQTTRPVTFKYRRWMITWTASLQVNSDYDLPDHDPHTTPHDAPEFGGPPIPVIPNRLIFRYDVNGDVETVTYTRD